MKFPDLAFGLLGELLMSQLDFGLIGNCQISALVDRQGKVVWCCMPRFDAPSVFSALLDSDAAGFWGVEPADAAGWETRQHYLRNTNVLVTQHAGPDGASFEVVDFMPRFERFDIMYRPTQIVRILRPVRG